MLVILWVVSFLIHAVLVVVLRNDCTLTPISHLFTQLLGKKVFFSEINMLLRVKWKVLILLKGKHPIHLVLRSVWPKASAMLQIWNALEVLADHSLMTPVGWLIACLNIVSLNLRNLKTESLLLGRSYILSWLVSGDFKPVWVVDCLRGLAIFKEGSAHFFLVKMVQMIVVELFSKESGIDLGVELNSDRNWFVFRDYVQAWAIVVNVSISHMIWVMLHGVR